ncbi:9508_t:CDS:2 [Ambispora leptoticha]|uniref:9508_t:CDS:1 n=1 Tax=Ambispora leptoticha TaxID=144679 RepID=A0A9N8VZW4_9GLOM|nr:9508_t:CDS:2 [Ambispora leptoticha]
MDFGIKNSQVETLRNTNDVNHNSSNTNNKINLHESVVVKDVKSALVTNRKIQRKLHDQRQLDSLTSEAPKGITATHNFKRAIQLTKEKVTKVSSMNTLNIPMKIYKLTEPCAKIQIAEECRKFNIRFRDIEFDISNTDASLYNSHDPEKDYSKRITDCKRINKIFEDPKFFSKSVDADDIEQGGIGDCWFLSSVSTCSNIPGLIETICVSRDEEVGVYGFIFFKDGDWISTVVDDQLYTHIDPETKKEILTFGRCKDHTSTWLPLLEKAYAKIHGDYENIDLGSIGHGLEDLTGGVANIYSTIDILDTERFWNETILTLNKTAVLGAGHSANWTPDPEGLVDNHAYSILEARELNGVKLLKIRNPYGGFPEWTGAWSDGSEQWTPENLAALNHKFGLDGVFWMAYEDFLTFFAFLFKCQIFDSSWNVYSAWINYNVKPKSDGKFRFTLKERAKVIIVLQQPDSRYFHEPPKFLYNLNFRIMDTTEQKFIIRNPYTITGFAFDRSTNAELELDAGTYEILPRIEAVVNPEASEIANRPVLAASVQLIDARARLAKGTNVTTLDGATVPETGMPVFVPSTSSHTPYIDPELAANKDRRGLNLKDGVDGNDDGYDEGDENQQHIQKNRWDLKLGLRLYTQSDGVVFSAHQGEYPVNSSVNEFESFYV